MSGGKFDYQQWQINEIAEQIKQIVVKNKVEVPPYDHERWDYNSDGELYDWAKYYYCLSDETIEKFKEAYKKLKEAYVYAQRIDWLMSGDDGEESFHRRLAEDLEAVEKNFKNEKWLYEPEEE